MKSLRVNRVPLWEKHQPDRADVLYIMREGGPVCGEHMVPCFNTGINIIIQKYLMVEGERESDRAAG